MVAWAHNAGSFTRAKGVNMNKPMLKTVRILAPGMITLICLLPFQTLRDIKKVSEAMSGNVFLLLITIAAVVIGAVYYALGLRNILWKRFVTRCHDNIWPKMIGPHYTNPQVKSIIDRIDDKRVMRIFYHVIDNDKSLSDQANDVRMNGAILSTLVDTILLLILFAVVYAVAALLTGERLFWILLMCAVVAQPVLWILASRVKAKHIALEDEQLAVIDQRYKADVLNELRKLQ